MFSAAQQVADTHESNQDARITASDERLTSVETKTKHQDLADEGTSDERHKHGRRLEATDKITVDSTADLADATFEAIAHTTNLAGLTLKRGNATTKLVHGSPAASSSLVVNATGNPADDKSILTAVHGSGEMTLGEGASTITAKTNVVEIVPTLGDAALTVKGTASTSNCTLRLLEGQTNQGFQIVANGGEDALNVIREDAGSTNTLLALKSDGQRIQQYYSDDGVEHNRVGVGNITHLSKVYGSSNTVSDQIRIGTGSTEGYNTVASNTSFAIQRVNGSTATDCISFDRLTGAATFASTVTLNAEVYAPAPVVKTVKLASFSPTGSIQDLWLHASAALFPSITIPTAQVQAGDIIEVYGSLAEDFASTKYPNIGSRFQYSIIAPGASGTTLNADQWSLCSGGDNSSDDAFGYFISRSSALTTAQAAGDVFIGLRYQAAPSHTVVRGIITTTLGAVSSLQVRVIRPVTVPTSS